jgi:hypothetical protein
MMIVRIKYSIFVKFRRTIKQKRKKKDHFHFFFRLYSWSLSIMSVLVPSFPNSHHHHFPNRYINGNFSTAKLNEDMNQDQVPFGVVNSMKQRLLDKVNESLLLNNRHSSRLSSNENLLQTKASLKPTVRLSRSQDNLLNNNINTEQFTSYLQPKQDVIIVETTISNDEGHRHSYTELHVDEVPKPGM